MGFWLSIWRTQKIENENELLKSQLAMSQAHEERLKGFVEAGYKREDDLRAMLDGCTELLSQVLIAVGRVKLFEGQPISSFEGLPHLVSMVVSDHEDLEGRIDAVVEYLRKVGEHRREAGPTEVPISVDDVRTTVGKLLQGAEPQIVDLQGGIDIKEE